MNALQYSVHTVIQVYQSLKAVLKQSRHSDRTKSQFSFRFVSDPDLQVGKEITTRKEKLCSSILNGLQ